MDVHPVARNVQWLVLPQRLGAAAFTAFGLLAVIVAAVGLSSVLSFLIVEQRRMHAIKVALGAAPQRIARGVLLHASVTVAVGMAAGYVLLVPVGKELEPILFRTHLLEPPTVVAVLVLGMALHWSRWRCRSDPCCERM